MEVLNRSRFTGSGEVSPFLRNSGASPFGFQQRGHIVRVVRTSSRHVIDAKTPQIQDLPRQVDTNMEWVFGK
jgi:hypothetical protein